MPRHQTRSQRNCLHRLHRPYGRIQAYCESTLTSSRSLRRSGSRSRRSRTASTDQLHQLL